MLWGARKIPSILAGQDSTIAAVGRLWHRCTVRLRDTCHGDHAILLPPALLKLTFSRLTERASFLHQSVTTVQVNSAAWGKNRVDLRIGFASSSGVNVFQRTVRGRAGVMSGGVGLRFAHREKQRGVAMRSGLLGRTHEAGGIDAPRVKLVRTAQGGKMAQCENCIIEAESVWRSSSCCALPPLCVHAVERERLAITEWDEA